MNPIEHAALRSAGYHEAGHSVFCCLYAMTVTEVLVHEPGSHPTEGGRCCIYEKDVEAVEQPFNYLVILFAGGAAERRATGLTPGDGLDRKLAVALASIVLNAHNDSPRVADLLETAELVASAKVQDDLTWKWIERVARVLMKKRRLSGHEVFELKPQAN